MSQTKAKPFRPFVVIDFTCDICGQKIEAVAIIESRALRHIKKAYHDKCWRESGLSKQIGAS